MDRARLLQRAHVHEPRTRARRYICLGKRALFLIDFEPPLQEMFYYAWIQRVIIDADNLLLFQVRARVASDSCRRHSVP